MATNYRKRLRNVTSVQKADARRKERKQNFVAWLNSIKTPCILCGEKNPYYLRLVPKAGEHLDFLVDESAWSRNRQRVAEQAVKCESVCLKCLRQGESGRVLLTNFIVRMKRGSKKHQ